MDSASGIEKLGLSVTETCERLGGVSRPSLYRIIAETPIRTYRIGSRRFFYKADVDAYVAGLLEDVAVAL